MSIPSATLALPLTPEQQIERLSERKALRRAATASFMGNFVEWFDYAAYGYLAPTSFWVPGPLITLALRSTTWSM